jgi:signal transduction histidine kinase
MFAARPAPFQAGLWPALLSIGDHWPVPPYALLIVLLAFIATIGVWWLRMRRLARQRAVVRAFAETGEAVLATGTPDGILGRLKRLLTVATSVVGVHVYLLNPASRELESVLAETGTPRRSFPLEASRGFLARALAACVGNRTPLVLSDTSKSPFVSSREIDPVPAAVMFLPMLRQGDLAGVLQLDYSSQSSGFPAEEQIAAQHLANLVAIAFKQIEQQSVREHLFRTEKLAAVGQLISSVATELRQPLENISRASAQCACSDREAIATEAARAAELVARLATITQTEQPEARVVELTALLETVLEYRAAEWEAEGLSLRVRILREPVRVLGSSAQLERVIVNLLARARLAAKRTPEQSVSVALAATGRRAQLEISFTHTAAEPGETEAPAPGDGAESGGLGLGVLRGIIQSHGGEIRLVRTTTASSRFEVELPIHQPPPAMSAPTAEPAPAPARQLTLLLLEPDEAVRRELIQMLSARRHRVVPASSFEEGRDLAQRLRFDGAFCALRIRGSNWIDLRDRLRDRLDFFILLTEAYEPHSDGFTLRKPLNTEEVARLLDVLEHRASPSPEPRRS